MAGIELTQPLKIGARIHISGHSTDLELTVESMQVDNAPVNKASAGRSVGIEVGDRVRRGDKVYRMVD